MILLGSLVFHRGALFAAAVRDVRDNAIRAGAVRPSAAAAAA